MNGEVGVGGNRANGQDGDQYEYVEDNEEGELSEDTDHGDGRSKGKMVKMVTGGLRPKEVR